MTRGNRRFDPGAELVRPPLFVWIPAALAFFFLMAPFAALIYKINWNYFIEDIGSPEIRSALVLSIVCSTAATILSVLLGFPLAWVLARAEFRGKELLRILILIPAVLPPIVGGVALMMAFGRSGVFGPALEELFNIRLPFTTAAVIIAETFIAMPLFVFSAEAGFRAIGARYDEAAATLGAGPWRRICFISIPLLGPWLVPGAALCWARALGELGATLTFAGSFPGTTQTMPLATLLALESKPDSAAAMGFVLLLISIVILFATRRYWRVPV
ncbi:MAG: ABC transporter permease [Planctomycetota bacterium]